MAISNRLSYLQAHRANKTEKPLEQLKESGDLQRLAVVAATLTAGFLAVPIDANACPECTSGGGDCTTASC
ncbi:MAG: hypothetical protein V4496_04100 [Pseudomonadota bacterium]